MSAPAWMRYETWSQMVNRQLQAGVFLVVVASAGIAGFYFNRASSISTVLPTAVGSAQRLMSAPLSDLSGKPQALMQWRGRVLVINFWATWCAPCREEIPALMRVQRKYDSKGVKVVGIAVDNVDKVREYAAEMRMDYTLLIGGLDTLVVARDLGNPAGVLPFSVVLDQDGKMAYSHAGKLTEASLVAILAPLL